MTRRQLQRALSVRQDCAYCGRPCSYTEYGPAYATIDHIVPRARGGGEGRSNKTLACLSCNREKRASADWHAAYTLADVLPPVGRADEDEWPEYDE